MIEIWRQCDARVSNRCGDRQRFVEPRGSIWDVKVGFEIPGYGELAHGGFSVSPFTPPDDERRKHANPVPSRTYSTETTSKSSCQKQAKTGPVLLVSVRGGCQQTRNSILP